MEYEEEQTQPPARIPLSQVLSWGGGTFLGVGALDLLAHLGPTGLVVGGIAAFVAARHGPDLMNQVQEHFVLPALPLPEKKEKPQQKSGRSVLDRALGRFPSEHETEVLEEEPAESPGDEAIFVSTSTQTEVPGVPRITVEQIARHTQRNSYQVYIGRSMTRPNNPAVKISFYKRHLKLIGASQHGKSSMAAALLDAITRTHDESLVQIAILDLEDKTGRLFEDVPHIARVRFGERMVRLHARSYEQVLQHLEHISRLIDYRYGLPSDELERLPLIIVYLEEFLDLKNYFKRRIDVVDPAYRDSARADYSRLIYIIGKVASRGLKVLVQLLMCSQVDYRDEDLQEALINITAGMSFCVRTSAAQAAGFYQTELLTRNAKEDKIGQAVVEMPDCKDLILAPEYDLGERLKYSFIHERGSLSSSNGLGAMNGMNGMNGLVKLNEYPMNIQGIHEYSGNIQRVSDEEKAAILAAAQTQLRMTGKIVRTKVRDDLGWNNAMFPKIKQVLDEEGL